MLLDDATVGWFILGINVTGYGVPRLDVISGCVFEVFLGDIST